MRLTCTICTALVVILCGCQRRILWEDLADRAVVPVSVNWERSQWKEYGETQRPSGMTLYVYDNDAKAKPMEVKTNNIEKASLILGEGWWNILVFNQSIDEYSSLGFRDMDDYKLARIETVPQQTRWFSSTRAEWLTRSNSPYASQTRADVLQEAEVSTTKQPIWIAVGHQDMVQVTEEMMKGNYVPHTRAQEDGGLEISPLPAIMKMKVKVHFTNFASLHSIRCVVSGIAGDWVMSSGKAGTSRTAHELTGWTVSQDGRASTSGAVETLMQTFGLPLDYDYSADAMYLHLDIMLKNGEVMSLDSPVGDMVEHDAGEGIQIMLDFGAGDEDSEHNPPIKLPDLQGIGGGGMDASVDGWNQEIVNITI